jgi:ATP-dependent DNA helicase DinG
MASTIAALYNEGGVGLLEAGTGVGKSLGYLLPALRWAAANRERTVVSTNTINLQEQLVGKDLPFLAGALTDQPVRFAMLKGWRNYLCLLRLEQASAGGAALFDGGVQEEVGSIKAWAERTGDGSLADLPTPPRAEVWDEVSAEPDLCTRTKCPHYSACFLYKARREAAAADVIVVNHHLLLADVAVRRTQQNWEDAAVLPAYSRLVIDEGPPPRGRGRRAPRDVGHAAVAHAALQPARAQGQGAAPLVVERLSARKDLLSVASLDLVHERLAPSVHAARDKASLVFDLLEAFLQEHAEPVVRLTDDFARHPIWRAGLDAAVTDVLGEIEMLGEGLRLVRERLEVDGKRDDAVAPLLNEMKAVTKRLQGAGDGLQNALRPPPGSSPTVRWIEVAGRSATSR